jgi:hypothetical protein
VLAPPNKPMQRPIAITCSAAGDQPRRVGWAPRARVLRYWRAGAERNVRPHGGAIMTLPIFWLRVLVAVPLLWPAIAAEPPVPTALPIPAKASCDHDRKQLLALDPDAFDQDMVGSWRRLALEEKCLGVAADLIRDYRSVNKNNAPILFWHEGQLRAAAGSEDEAIPLLEQAKKPPESSIGWNEYVDATIAFLRNDRAAFDKARAALLATTRPAGFDARLPDGRPVPWPINSDVVDRLARCFGLPYRQAYSACSK